MDSSKRPAKQSAKAIAKQLRRCSWLGGPLLGRYLVGNAHSKELPFDEHLVILNRHLERVEAAWCRVRSHLLAFQVELFVMAETPETLLFPVISYLGTQPRRPRR